MDSLHGPLSSPCLGFSLPVTEAPSCPTLPPEGKHSGGLHPVQETSGTNGCVKLKGNQEHVRQKSHSPSCGEECSPPPTKGKKKKKKSTRKKRRRSSSGSPSPPKKKKKKKNSKKRKRNRLSSKKRRHSSSSPKSKRKEERKHKKHSRGRQPKSQRHRHRHGRAGSESTNSFSESHGSRPRSRSREKNHNTRWKRLRNSSKCARKPNRAAEVTVATPLLGCTIQNSFPSTTEVISKSGSSADLFKKAEGRVAKTNGEPREYDSGNDTSSPPSTQTSTSGSKGRQEASCPIHDGFDHACSSGKTSSGSGSDSGNSFTSCFSQTKGATLEDPAASPHVPGKGRRNGSLHSFEPSEKKKGSLVSAPFPGSPLRPGVRNGSSSSRSSSLESAHSHLLNRKPGSRSAQSRSCSSGTRSYSRSPSHSPKSCKRSPGSRSSRQRRSPSYSRYSPSSRDRAQDHKYGSSGKDSHRHHDRRRRKQSYSPMRKRRRDSPSHLEARRITSARKRPIPYYRPSPSSSSPSSISSYSSWYSSFSHSPSRSRSHSRSPSSGRTCRSWSSSSSGGSSHSSAPRHSRRSRSGSSSSTGSDDSLRR